MDTKKVLADFQMLTNRVSKLDLDGLSLNRPDFKLTMEYDIDYNIIAVEKNDDQWVGLEEVYVCIKVNSDTENIFHINLTMEGIFIGDSNKIEKDKFIERLELNGLATLCHLSRAYLISVSSLSGINPPFRLPMINVHSLVKMKKEKEDAKNIKG